MSVGLDPVDLSAATVGKSGPLDWTGKVQPGGSVTVGGGKAHLRLRNESNLGLFIALGSGGSTSHFAAGEWGDFELNGEQRLTWTVEYQLNGPSPNLLLGTVYAPGERVPPLSVLGNSAVGIGGTVTTSATPSIKNDGNAPATSTYETTPSDQAASSIQDYNDGSGFRKILSANVMRIIWNIVRGTAGAVKAAIQLGDSGDPTILVVYGAIQGGQDANIGNVTCKTISFGDLFFSTQSQIFFSSANPYVAYATPLAGGSALGHLFETWNGAASKLPFSIGGRFAGASAWVDNAGVINVPGGQALGTKSNGGGASGATVWVGTTDPGVNAAEGDLWVAI